MCGERSKNGKGGFFVDKDVMLNKLESLRRCVKRIQDKTPPSSDALKENIDLQDIIVLNLERAVQICVDIGMHRISELETPVPDTMSETFKNLNRAGILDDAITERMVKAVGFRNTAVHAYQEMDWEIVYRIITEHLNDFRDFAGQMMRSVK